MYLPKASSIAYYDSMKDAGEKVKISDRMLSRLKACNEGLLEPGERDYY